MAKDKKTPAKTPNISTLVLWDLENLHVAASDKIYGRKMLGSDVTINSILPVQDIAGMLRREAGKLIQHRMFADWSRFNAYDSMVLQVRGTPVHTPSPTRKTKNTADMYMAVQAMEQLILTKGAKRIILLTGDSDFVPLVTRLANAGCEVWLGAFQNTVSRVLSCMVDRFFELDMLLKAEPAEDTPADQAWDAKHPKLGAAEKDLLRDYVRQLTTATGLKGSELAVKLPIIRNWVGALARENEKVWLRDICRFAGSHLLLHGHRDDSPAIQLVWNVLRGSYLVIPDGELYVWNSDILPDDRTPYLHHLFGDLA